MLLAVVEFLVIVVYFYAPRTNGETPGFDTLVSEPTALPAVVGEATLGSWNAFVSQWISGDSQSHAYLPYLGDLVETLVVGSGALVVLAVIGFLADRYADDGPRDLVAFAFYCGFVSVLGYPIITDIMAPWAAVHAVVFLMLPAAVGAGVLYTRGKAALAHDDRPGSPRRSSSSCSSSARSATSGSRTSISTTSRSRTRSSSTLSPPTTSDPRSRRWPP